MENLFRRARSLGRLGRNPSKRERLEALDSQIIELAAERDALIRAEAQTLPTHPTVREPRQCPPKQKAPRDA